MDRTLDVTRVQASERSVHHPNVPRRDVLFASALAQLCIQGPTWASEGLSPSRSILPQRDLDFPQEFVGTWAVTSVLQAIDLPFGEVVVPDIQQIRRAERDDLNQKLQYNVRFVTGLNPEAPSATTMDRKFNTASLIETYMNFSHQEALDRIQWNPAKPDHMEISLSGGLRITSDITSRSSRMLASDLMETNEFFQQFVDDPRSQNVRLKASRAYTKWRWRSSSSDDQSAPTIVATQVIAEFLDPNDQQAPLESLGKPITIFTYRLSLRRL